MSKRISRSVMTVVGVGLALMLATPVMATEARDMKGNKVMIDDQTGFTYGGDNKAGYAGGKIATGKKDPAVCGTFGGDTCSVGHLKK